MLKSYPYIVLGFLALSLNLFAEKENPGVDLIYQKITNLEKEIAILRSLIEENTFLIEKSHELQKQRYMDLDKRLHELKIQGLSSSEKGTLTILNDGLPKEEISTNKEASLYKEALELFNSGMYAEALGKFRQQIISFPEGQFIPDAYFWSGELYLSQKKLEDARENYLVIITKYEDHARAADSLYKLAEIARNLSQTEISESYLLEVIDKYPETGAAQLAKNYLKMQEERSNEEG
mgnify:FL=1